MDIMLTEDTKVTFLLCGVLGKNYLQKQDFIQPLNTKEYNNLVQWLVKAELRPKDLLQSKVVSTAAQGTHIEEQRLQLLLGRGVQLGFAIEEWQRNGIWLISRSDADYPLRFKEHLNGQAPALLFGIGNRSLLQGGGLGIVGSRTIDDEGSDFTRQVATLCAQNKIPIVSGGAKGVDSIAMNTTLELGGVAIGVLADSLFHKSLEKSVRKALAHGQLLLISPFNPEASFSVGTAMARNKLIYAMADYGLIVSADFEKGGTWSGAKEELKRPHARPLFVRHEKNIPQGNAKLLELGARPWPEVSSSENLFESLQEVAKTFVPPASENTVQQSLLSLTSEITNIMPSTQCHPKVEQEIQVKPQEDAPLPFIDVTTALYTTFVTLFLERVSSPLTLEEIADIFSLNKKQASDWLREAVVENKIKKFTKPTRYGKTESAIRGNLLQ